MIGQPEIAFHEFVFEVALPAFPRQTEGEERPAGARAHGGDIRERDGQSLISEQTRSRASMKVYFFDEQVCSDDQIAIRRLADNGRIVPYAFNYSRGMLA